MRAENRGHVLVLQDCGGEPMPQHVRTHVLGDPLRFASRFDDVLACDVLTGNAFSRAK